VRSGPGRGIGRDAGTCLTAAAAAALLLLTGCSGVSEGPEKVVEAAIVPGADILGRIDYGEYRASPAAETIRKQRLEQNPALVEAEEERVRKLEEATGVSPDDLRAILFSGDLDGIDISSPEPDSEYLKLNAVLAATFDGVLTAEQFEAGLKVIALEIPGSRVEEAEVGGRRVFSLFADGKAEPVLYGSLSLDGRTIFLTPNGRSMEGVFLREKEGRTESLSESLTTAERGLPEGSQFTTSFVLPEQLRRQIETRVSAAERQAMKNPVAGMILGFITPFRKLSSLSFGASFAEGAQLGAAADLGGESEAMQAVAILQTMVLPFLKARLAQGGGRSMEDLEGKLGVASSGPTLRLEVKLEAEDLKNLRF
jgi:hypothetical protein